MNAIRLGTSADGKVRPPGLFKTFKYSKASRAFPVLQIGKIFDKIILTLNDDDCTKPPSVLV